MTDELKRFSEPDSVRSFLKELFPLEFHQLVWLVGGSVRDALLHKEISDIDLVAAVPPAVLESLGFSHVEAVTTSPIWFRHFPGYGNLEITRLESAAALDADLQRRDFTLNAILMSLDGDILDPLGGQGALTKLALEPCSPATFIDDPIRIFRAFRFAAEGFTVSPEAYGLIRSREWTEELERLPVERFSREMLKALQAPVPGRFFEQMLASGVGAGLLPELFRMAQIPAGPPQHHPEGDLFSHSRQVLARVAAMTAAPLARFSAFFHDIGKLSTDPGLYPSHHGHGTAGFKSAEAFCRRLALPSAYGRALAWTSRLHGDLNRFAELRPGSRMRLACQAVKGGVAELLPLISAADKPGSDISGEWRELLSVAGLTVAGLGIDAARLARVEPEKRSEFILQRRVEYLRRICGAAKS